MPLTFHLLGELFRQVDERGQKQIYIAYNQRIVQMLRERASADP